MKKILMWIGAVAVAAVVGIVATIAVLALRGVALDKSSREYASKLLDTALKDWDIEAIQSESSSQMREAVKREDLARVLRAFKERLGSIKAYDAPRGDANINVMN
jgi:hypothetical protein